MEGDYFEGDGGQQAQSYFLSKLQHQSRKVLMPLCIVTLMRNGITNSVALVCERTLPTERPPVVGEVSANFCGERGVAWSVRLIPYGRNLGFLGRVRNGILYESRVVSVIIHLAIDWISERLKDGLLVSLSESHHTAVGCTVTELLDIIHRPVSEIRFCVRLEVEPTQLSPMEMSSPTLHTPAHDTVYKSSSI
jgi:hypothetical protein